MDSLKTFMLFLWAALSVIGVVGTLMTAGSAFINEDEDSRFACILFVTFTGLLALPTLSALRH